MRLSFGIKQSVSGKLNQSVLLFTLVCFSSFAILGQQPQKKTNKAPRDDTRNVRQQEQIGRLVAISNELKGEADKPSAALLQSEVADVLWQFDEPVARSIFRLAFDTIRQDITNSGSSTETNPDRNSLVQSRRRISAIRVVLNRYGLHDRKSADAWLREFENDVVSKQRTTDTRFKMSPEQAELLADIAAGMVSQNAKEAQRLGSLSLSSARIPSSFGRLLMALRSTDKALSDILFRQALISLRMNGFAYDPALISLTNYAFFSDGKPFPDISSADVGLIVAYFADAADVQSSRSRSGTIRTAGDQASLGSFYGFLSNRVLPIVALNAPDRLLLLKSNTEEVAQALTLEQRRQAEMLASLSPANSKQGSENSSDIESRIRRAEQEKDVKTRDSLLRSLALQLMRSEPERALEVAEKIDDRELRAQTQDDVYLVLLRRSFESRDDAEAKTVALKLNDICLRARWLARIAGNIQDKAEAAALLSHAHSFASKSDNTPVKLDVLLLIAKQLVRFDQVRGFEILSEAINTTNRLEKGSSKSSNSVPAVRVITMTVVDGEEVSTDDRVTIDSIDFNQIASFVELDYLRTTFLGNDVRDRILRSKYFIALARSVLQVPRKGSGYERTVDDLIRF
ncbi:MAG TPA: hypothetical protein VLA93_13960 [Pyrinomonadaceae bacterium]|nr:hypothetical protein [Pyrinomonadaceae bacterium]